MMCTTKDLLHFPEAIKAAELRLHMIKYLSRFTHKLLGEQSCIYFLETCLCRELADVLWQNQTQNYNQCDLIKSHFLKA